MAARKKANFTLTRAIKRKWIAMLRSGDYAQGFSRLYRNGGYCPLGVLCLAVGIPQADIVDKKFPQDAGLTYEDAPTLFAYDAWQLPVFMGEMVPISKLNDLDGYSFDQLADIIQQTVGTH